MNTRTLLDAVDTTAGNIGFEGSKLAYIKPMNEAEARALGIVPSEIVLPKGITLFAIHTADGTPVAIMDNWASAYGAAVQNDLTPVSLH